MLVLFHFFAPFFLLLFRVMTQSPARLAAIAALIFLAHAVEAYWLVEPAFSRRRFISTGSILPPWPGWAAYGSRPSPRFYSAGLCCP